MSEKRYVEFGARVLLPAAVCSLAIWYSGVSVIQAAQSNLLALFVCYLAGYAALAYAGELGIQRTIRFYALFAGLAFAGALVAGGLLQKSPVASFNSILFPLALAFVAPAVLEMIKERVANVQAQ